MADLSKIYLFRMTHIENIPHILQYGITHIDSQNCNSNYIAIGDNSLISKRNEITTNDKSRLGDYIPFYFGVRMPMLYVVQKGFNGVASTSAENIVYCVSSIEQIVKHKLNFLFTDGHAVDSFSSFYSQENLNEINDILDFDAIKRRYWVTENDLDLKRRKEAEFLIKGDIPISAIIGFVVFNENAKNRLLDFDVDKSIIVKPTYYF